MDLHPPGRNGLEFSRSFNNELCPFIIKQTFWAHSADNTAPPDSNVSVFMGQEDGRADPLVSSAGRVGSINSCQNRNAQFFQFRMSEESRSASSSVGIYFLLFWEFHTTAVDQPNQRDMKKLCA